MSLVIGVDENKIKCVKTFAVKYIHARSQVSHISIEKKPKCNDSKADFLGDWTVNEEGFYVLKSSSANNAMFDLAVSMGLQGQKNAFCMT